MKQSPDFCLSWENSASDFRVSAIKLWTIFVLSKKYSKLAINITSKWIILIKNKKTNWSPWVSLWAGQGTANFFWYQYFIYNTGSWKILFQYYTKLYIELQNIITFFYPIKDYISLFCCHLFKLKQPSVFL